MCVDYDYTFSNISSGERRRRRKSEYQEHLTSIKIQRKKKTLKSGSIFCKVASSSAVAMLLKESCITRLNTLKEFDAVAKDAISD
jgi:hypothetical protein